MNRIYTSAGLSTPATDFTKVLFEARLQRKAKRHAAENAGHPDDAQEGVHPHQLF